MSNVLLVDTNFSSGPIYHFLKQLGHHVIVVGGNPNDALAKSVDDYVQLDYSDVGKTNRLVVDHKIDYLVPGCNDRSYMVCAAIDKDGRFPGIDPLATAEVINNKKKFRDFTIQHDLSAPRVLSEQEIGTRWPVIVKPVDGYSGRGVKIIREENSYELSKALTEARQASPTGTCIVEDFIDGQLFSHTAFIQNCKIVSDHVVEEHGSANPFVVDTSRVYYELPAAILERIRKDLTLLARKLRLEDGLLHTQLLRNADQYWLIEVTRRCPGDLYSQLIELSTGQNYAENYVRPFVELPFNIAKNDRKRWIMRHTMTQPHDYILGSFSFHLPLLIKKWVPISQTGDRVRGSPFGRIGIFFAEMPSELVLNGVVEKTLKRELYSVSPF